MYPTTYHSLYDKTLPSAAMLGYLVLQCDTWWACSMRLTSCAHAQVIVNKKGFCVLVGLVPKLLYHSDEEFLTRWSSLLGKNQ